MYDPEMRKDCPMRGNLGNCSPVGGFCMDAVSDEICEAVHNAYQHGYSDAISMLKEQEAKTPVECEDEGYWYYRCPTCGHHEDLLREWNYCPFCGQAVKWE